ncbi:FG-GAP repeat protein [Hymenobacter negativus]|uniref:VCBS repeat-containing protein n=1 Tax=Hymenobacter negativus TaxID=2795026 RepID=A0ABS3QGR8_9BACT|nr:hypothetical protein [Hymenobacter negativus]MBO2010442.1 hypothetical protein [Hymenobacter negativus]
MRIFFVAAGFLSLVTSGNAWGQASYSGTIGTLSIELALDSQGEGEMDGTYFYKKFGTPIALHGTSAKGVLTLTESDGRGKPSARLTIPTFATDQQSIVGTWQNLTTGQKLPLLLTQQATSGPDQDSTGLQELLQASALKTCYFKVVLSSSESISSVKLYEKRTGRLVQEVKADCESRGIRSVSVGDFNFDGLEDFAVYQQGFAGPNTASLYFLYDPNTKQYIDSGFEGVSLQFDAKTKRVSETNSCCAGSSVQNSVYKIVRNRMVLVEQHCYKWDEKKQELVERKLSACQ